MKTIKATPGEAIFKCERLTCDHLVVFRWPLQAAAMRMAA